MRHQTEYIPGLIADTRNMAGASIGVGFRRYITVFITIFPKHLSVGFEFIQGFIICIIPSLTMGDRNFQRPGVILGEINIFADELLVCIPKQDSWQ